MVAKLQKGLSDPLAEAETLAQFHKIFSEQGVPEEERSRCSKLLERCVQPEVPRAPEELTRQEEEPQVFSSTKTGRGRRTSVAGTATQRSSGRCVRVRCTSHGSPGQESKGSQSQDSSPWFYICRSGKKKVRSLLPSRRGLHGLVMPRAQSTMAYVGSALVGESSSSSSEGSGCRPIQTSSLPSPKKVPFRSVSAGPRPER